MWYGTMWETENNIKTELGSISKTTLCRSYPSLSMCGRCFGVPRMCFLWKWLKSSFSGCTSQPAPLKPNRQKHGLDVTGGIHAYAQGKRENLYKTASTFYTQGKKTQKTIWIWTQECSPNWALIKFKDEKKKKHQTRVWHCNIGKQLMPSHCFKYN